MVSRTKSNRFLWVHFQLIDLCNATSDEDIREVLEHLPEGLYNTYTRIFNKIAKTGSKATVEKIMMWMVCARRPLRVEELQEAVAFTSSDKSWNANKIPDGDRMIKSCHGLVTRDVEKETEKVCLAHHTVQQYLVCHQKLESATSIGEFKESTLTEDYWPELYKLRCNSKAAEIMAGKICMTYLCFSDFRTAIDNIHNRKMDITAAFRDHGPVSIPAMLGLGKKLHNLPYRFFGCHKDFEMPKIDYSKYLSVMPRDRRPSQVFRKKFALLEYVIQHWPWHTRWLQWSSEPGSGSKFWDVVQHESLAFEFRPWGQNQHFGPYGCKSCPVLDPYDLEPNDLSSMGLLHWAAETGHLEVFDIIKPSLEQYLRHERHHSETLLIACRNGQDAVVELLLARGSYDLSDGRAMIAVCASGKASILEHLIRVQDNFRKFVSTALYQAASNGHDNVVEVLLPKMTQPYITDPPTGLTSFQIAAKNGYLEAVRALSSAPVLKVLPNDSLDPPHESTGMRALHHAGIHGHDHIVTFLLEHGLKPNDLDALGETALIKASRNGQATAAKALLEGGADPLIRGGEGQDLMEPGPGVFFGGPRYVNITNPMAIHYAAANGHDNVLAILPYSKSRCGSSNDANALRIGAASGHPKVLQTLLQKGARIGSEDTAGLTALHHASRMGHHLVVQVLLDRGCKIDRADDDGYTALHHAAKAAKIETIKVLVTRGASITAESADGETVLHIAAETADAVTIRTLVECGAPLESRSKNGQTALLTAINSNQPANVRVLASMGVECFYNEVISASVNSETTEMVEILLERLSMATASEQSHATTVIKMVLASSKTPKRSQALRLLEDGLKTYPITAETQEM